MGAIDRAFIQLMCAKEFAKNALKEKFFGDERGISTVVEIIIIIAIVLMVAYFFRDKIKEFVSTLWSNTNDDIQTDGFEMPS